MRQTLVFIVETKRCNVISQIHCSMVFFKINNDFDDFLRFLTHHKTHVNLKQHLFYFVHLHTEDVCGGIRSKIRRTGVADSCVVCDESNNVELS